MQNGGDNMKVTLKAARINAGLTQNEAALKLNVSKDSVSNWERGKTYPDIPVLKRIEKLYGVDYKDIIFCQQITV